MGVFKKLTCLAGSCYYFLREKISPSRIRDGREIPIIINNYNRLTTLRRLIDALTSRGYSRIYILDNDSSYPPLLEYYATCPFEVIRLGRNIGFKALWESEARKRFCGDYYAYTDSDVVPAEDCPADFMDHFLRELRRHPLARKVGFSLRIDNLPDHFAQKRQVIEAEEKYYRHPVSGGLYQAPIDTTFALYRPRVGLSRSRAVEAYRTAAPYQAEHLPWYTDSARPSEEERYYLSHCVRMTEWSSRAKRQNP